MAIDDSILTYSICAICILIFCTRTYKKTKNPLRTFFVFLWIVAIYNVISCSIFPIQFTSTGLPMYSFEQQFSLTTFEYLKKYFWEHFQNKTTYFASYLSLAFVAGILFAKMRRIWRAMLLMVSLLLIHLVYNVWLNVTVNEVVKIVDVVDFIVIALGYSIGWICAKITLAVYPPLAEKLLVKKSGE